MRTYLTVAALVASCSMVLAAGDEGLIGLSKNATCKHDPLNSKEITVMLNNTEVVDAEAVLNKVGRTADDDGVFRILKNSAFTALIMNATQGCQEALNALDDVAFIEETSVVQSFVTQKTGSTWGLQRVSNDAGASGNAQAQDFTYSYEDESLGKGVDIYVVDTGVRTTHAVFGGRATVGFSALNTSTDGDGHGTHVAGSAAGAKFGVAQGANIIAVKVLGDDGSGSSSDTIAGMDWVINQHNKRKSADGFVGSIMSMSWGLQGTASSVNDAIKGALSAGIHVSVAAGNDGTDACSSTPAQLGGSNSDVVTVGSINIQNAVSSFSNIGKCVDIYAPGEQILSAWNTADNTINYLSGTSMATPHNSGVMAYLMAQDPSNLGQNPKALKAKLLATARQNDVTGSLGGSANLLLSNGVNGNVAAAGTKRSVLVEEKRTVTGGPASWAKNLVDNLGKRWQLYSTESPVRF